MIWTRKTALLQPGCPSMRDRPLIVFAGGGTGGHLFPAVAVAEALVRRSDDLEIEFYTTHRPLDEQVLGGRGWRTTSQC